MSDASHGDAREEIDARFIDGPGGPLFCLCAASGNCNYIGDVSNARSPEKKRRNKAGYRHIVLFLPPFGEEINLCRRFSSLLRTHLSMAGLCSVLPDLYGTGDSAGHFEEATWEMWLSDLEYVVKKYCLGTIEGDAANRLSIVAVRAGCLFTQHLLKSTLFLDSRIKLENIVFVQPEINGFDIVNRLFRARITAQRFSGNKSQTSADLWACIERGKTVHAGGHALSSKLCKALQNIHLEFEMPLHFKNQTLFTLEPGTDLQNTTDWRVIHSSSKPFWQSYDIEPDSALIRTVAAAFQS